ncbi:MAG: hypothetical protein ACI9R3_006591 [Verrucomicrobiales bacterium]|jgi:hypothetical protein
MSAQETNPQLASLQNKALIIGAIGVALSIAGYLSDADQFYKSYLTAYLYWLAPTLGCMGWTMIYHLTEGSWAAPARRIWESGGRVMPLMAVLVIPIILGMETLFSWARPEAADDAIIQAKAAYLNPAFFTIRAIFFVSLWTLIGFLLSKYSLQQDKDGPEPSVRRLRFVSGAGLVLMALSLTFASVDWVMSLDPHWFSTIFGFLFAVSDLLTAMAFTILFVRMLEKTDALRKLVTTDTYHDYGNLTMAFVMLWTYMNLSQFLIIWSGNTQEEAPWYMARMDPGWIVLSISLIIFHFALPFLILLTRRTKRSPGLLAKVAIFLLFMRFLDLYWLTQPSLTHEAGIHFHWLDAVTMIAVGGMWVGVFAMQLKNKPLVPAKDPRVVELLQNVGGHH